MNRLVEYLWSLNEFWVFTRNLLFEARGEPDEGVAAVGWVVLNRLDDERWPGEESLNSIILAPNQFSWTRPDDPQHRLAFAPWERFPREWRRAKEIAGRVLNGCLADPTDGANHYLNVRACRRSRWGVPSWFDPDKVTAVIGRHTFLKL